MSKKRNSWTSIPQLIQISFKIQSHELKWISKIYKKNHNNSHNTNISTNNIKKNYNKKKTHITVNPYYEYSLEVINTYVSAIFYGSLNKINSDKILSVFLSFFSSFSINYLSIVTDTRPTLSRPRLPPCSNTGGHNHDWQHQLLITATFWSTFYL